MAIFPDKTTRGAIRAGAREEMVLGFSTVDVRTQDGTPCAGTPPPPRRRGPRGDRFATSGIEPSIEELMSDPLTAAVMRRDGVSEDGLRSLIVATRQVLRSRAGVA